MAVIHSVLGFMKGKVQNVIIAQQKGQTTMRAYQPNVANPDTEKQRSNRDVLAYVLLLANYLNFLVLVPYLTPKLRKQSPINAFVAQLGKIITQIADSNGSIRYEVITDNLDSIADSNLMVSNGPKSINMLNYSSLDTNSSTSNQATLDAWSYIGENLSPKDRATDKFTCVALNISDPKPPTVTITNAPRSEGEANGNIVIPNRAAGDIILIFGFFYNETDGETSKGMVLGRLVGTTWTPTINRPYIG